MAEPSVPETVEPINQRPWRELFGVHPACELFPPRSPAEIADLAEDMKQRGMLVPLLMYRRDDGGLDVVDGRGRLDAFTLAGLANPQVLHDYGDNDSTVWLVLSDDDDPWAVAIAANAKRRHLTAAMRREAIGKYLALRPEQSDRQIAAMFAVDHKTVGAVRKQGIATGEISPVERTTGADGKSRPVVRKAPAKTVPVKTTPAPARAAALEHPAERVAEPAITAQEAAALAREVVAREAAAARDADPDLSENNPDLALSARSALKLRRVMREIGISEADLARLWDVFEDTYMARIVEEPDEFALLLVERIGLRATDDFCSVLFDMLVEGTYDRRFRDDDPEDDEDDPEEEAEPGPLVWRGTEEIGHTAHIQHGAMTHAASSTAGYLILGPEHERHPGPSYRVYPVDRARLDVYNRDRKRRFKWAIALRQPSLSGTDRLLKLGIGDPLGEAATLEAAQALAEADHARPGAVEPPPVEPAPEPSATFRRVTRSDSYVMDGSTPIRWVATELEKAGDAGLTVPQLAPQLAAYYQQGTLYHDLTRIKLNELKAKKAPDREATEWLVAWVLTQLEHDEHGNRQIAERDGVYRLAVPFDDLRHRGAGVARHA